MEWITLAEQLGLTPLNVVLIGMLYFFGAKMGIFPKLWKNGDKYEPSRPIMTIGKLADKMAKLEQYWNHDITKQNEAILTALKEITDKMDRHNDMEKENHTKLQEILTYGVKVREK